MMDSPVQFPSFNDPFAGYTQGVGKTKGPLENIAETFKTQEDVGEELRKSVGLSNMTSEMNRAISSMIANIK